MYWPGVVIDVRSRRPRERDQEQRSPPAGRRADKNRALFRHRAAARVAQNVPPSDMPRVAGRDRGHELRLDLPVFSTGPVGSRSAEEPAPRTPGAGDGSRSGRRWSRRRRCPPASGPWRCRSVGPSRCSFPSSYRSSPARAGATTRKIAPVTMLAPPSPDDQPRRDGVLARLDGRRGRAGRHRRRRCRGGSGAAAICRLRFSIPILCVAMSGDSGRARRTSRARAAPRDRFPEQLVGRAR